MGKTFKDRRKFDRKQERNDGLREQKREPKRPRWRENELSEDFDPYELYDDEYKDD